MTTRILALVGDCYGAPGGIARYNQDLFEALADGDADILVLPRLGEASGMMLPAGIRQLPPVFGRLAFLISSLRAAWHHRPVDIVFCGHAYMAPLAWIVASVDTRTTVGAGAWRRDLGRPAQQRASRD